MVFLLGCLGGLCGPGGLCGQGGQGGQGGLSGLDLGGHGETKGHPKNN